MPNIWNDTLATVGQKTELLFNIRNSMGPGLTRMLTTLRTPSGRPVSEGCNHIFDWRSLAVFEYKYGSDNYFFVP
jgi:hypothetical protein